MRKSVISSLSLLLAPVTAACFTASFDGDADDVFFCQADADCQEEQSCTVLHRCLSDTGPSLQIKGPKPLLEIPVDEAEIVLITISGTGFSLGDEGQESIEVMLDGQLLLTIVEWELEEDVSFYADLSGPAGIHRLSAQAVRADGTHYKNPDSLAQSLFWLDDGFPHVGIQKPFAGSLLPAGENLEVEIVTINFELVNPTFDDDPGEGNHGYVNLYLDRDDFPGCLPSCSQSYAEGGELFPEDNSRTQFVNGTIMEVPGVGGDLNIEVLLSYGTGYPYPANTDTVAVWNTGIFDHLLVIDQIKVTLVK